MTSTPDQFPAATEVGKVSATDPVDEAAEAESEPDPGPDDAAGTGKSGSSESGSSESGSSESGSSESGTSADESERADDASDVEEPADGAIESLPTANAVAPTDKASGEESSAAGTATADPDDDGADEPKAEAEPEADEAETTAETSSGLPRRPKRDQAATEEIRIVPPQVRPAPATPAPGAPTPNGQAGAPASNGQAETPTPEPEPAAEPDRATAAETADAGPTTSATSGTTEPPTPSGGATAPVIDETFDFKALSFAAITEAHKRELGPRTVVGEVKTPGEPASDEQKAEDQTAAETTSAEATSAETTSAETASAAEASAPAEAPVEAAAEPEAPASTPELFASPTTHTPPTPAPPSPFPTPAAPPQHHPGAPAQAPPTVPQQQPPSPFPASPGGSAHGFPAVHDYAPEATYAGWRPPTPEEDSAKRRRFALIGGAVVAVIAVVAVVAVVVNLVNRQQWEPIDAMIAEPQEVHPLQLVLGSCVESIPDDGEVTEVLAVPCDASHTAQVVGRTDFADAAVWPGRDEVDRRVALVCGTKQLGPVARTSPLADSVRYVVWGPSEESWDDGDRVGLCLATTADPITQDLLQ